MMNQLDGKTALITGSGSGIGRSTALLMAENGAKVIVSDINEKGGNETVDLIKEKGGEATFIKADVANASESEIINNRIVKILKKQKSS